MNPVRNFFISICLLSFLCSCSDEGDSTQITAPQTPKLAGESNQPVFLFLGDSLTAGYGLAEDQAYPALLADKLREKGVSWKVRNASVDGYTTMDVLTNLEWFLVGDVKTVFLAIGGNDGLRGLDLEKSRQNITAIVERCQSAGIDVVLAGMKIPPNYGSEYTQKFAAMYGGIATKYKLKLLPFLLEGVAGRAEYNLADGIHPNEQGHKIIAERVWEFLQREDILP